MPVWSLKSDVFDSRSVVGEPFNSLRLGLVLWERACSRRRTVASKLAPTKDTPDGFGLQCPKLVFLGSLLGWHYGSPVARFRTVDAAAVLQSFRLRFAFVRFKCVKQVGEQFAQRGRIGSAFAQEG